MCNAAKQAVRALATGAALALSTLPGRSQVVLPPDGRPAGIACAYNSAPPSLASGQIGFVQCDTNGKLIISNPGGSSSSSGGVVYGNDATGAAPTKNPLFIAGIDGSGNIKPAVLTALGALTTSDALADLALGNTSDTAATISGGSVGNGSTVAQLKAAVNQLAAIVAKLPTNTAPLQTNGTVTANQGTAGLGPVARDPLPRRCGAIGLQSDLRHNLRRGIPDLRTLDLQPNPTRWRNPRCANRLRHSANRQRCWRQCQRNRHRSRHQRRDCRQSNQRPECGGVCLPRRPLGVQSAQGTPLATAAGQANTAPGTSATTAQGVQGVTGGVAISTAEAGSSSASVGVAPLIAISGGAVSVASVHNLYGAYVTNGTTTAGYMVITNLAAVPASGATLSASTTYDCVPMPAQPGQAIHPLASGPPDYYSAGITLLLSTSCSTYTPGSLSGFIKIVAR